MNRILKIILAIIVIIFIVVSVWYFVSNNKSSASATNTSIVGTAQVVKVGGAVYKAKVSVKCTNLSQCGAYNTTTETDWNGFYMLNNVNLKTNTGTLEIQFTKNDFETLKETVTLQAGTTNLHNVALKPIKGSISGFVTVDGNSNGFTAKVTVSKTQGGKPIKTATTIEGTPGRFWVSGLDTGDYYLKATIIDAVPFGNTNEKPINIVGASASTVAAIKTFDLVYLVEINIPLDIPVP